jgi:hypothetical protein
VSLDASFSDVKALFEAITGVKLQKNDMVLLFKKAVDTVYNAERQ